MTSPDSPQKMMPRRTVRYDKRCYGVKTDARSVEINMDLNPMIAGCFIKLFKNFDGDALIEELEQYLSGNEL